MYIYVCMYVCMYGNLFVCLRVFVVGQSTSHPCMYIFLLSLSLSVSFFSPCLSVIILPCSCGGGGIRITPISPSHLWSETFSRPNTCADQSSYGPILTHTHLTHTQIIYTPPHSRKHRRQSTVLMVAPDRGRGRGGWKESSRRLRIKVVWIS